MTNMKKMLALLLAVVMVLGMIPFGAMAEEAETVTHIETCLENCALEDCACECHAEPETPAEPKQEENPVTPLSLDDTTTEETPVVDATKTEETPVCTCTPVEGVHAEGCALYVKPEAPVEEPKTEETPVCTCTPVEGVHAEGCALYVKPEAPVEEPKTEETPVCTCTPVEGVHAEACALYVKPEEPVCTCTPVEGVHAEGCALADTEEKEEEKQCTCIPIEGVHADDCPLYEVIEEETEPEETPLDIFYNAVMSATTHEEIMLALELYSEIEIKAFLSELDEERANALDEHIKEIYPSEPIPSLNVVSVSGIGPFLPAVQKASPWARFALRSSSTESENGLILAKSAERIDKTNEYKITLESFVTGSINISTKAPDPCDIVLVLDVSGSMEYSTSGVGSDALIDVASSSEIAANPNLLDTNYGAAEGVYKYATTGGFFGGTSYSDMRYSNGKWQYKSGYSWNDVSSSTNWWNSGTICIEKIDALKIAVQNFIDNVNAKSVDSLGNPIDHRISIVKFASDKTDAVGNDTLSSGYNYSQIVCGLTTVSGNSSTLKNNVTSIRAAGATSADYGMQHAQTVLDGIPSTRKSNRIVIMFTDGQPNHGSGFNEGVANDTIKAGKAIKEDGATVYTIGVFEGANDTVPMSNSVDRMNRYMHYVSSNFKTAESLSDDGDGATYPDSGSYYKAASNSSQLNSIFETIASNVPSGGASIELDEKTEVRDIVTEYFNAPAASAISVYTAPYKGYDANGERIFGERVAYDADVESANNTIRVSNFNYSSDENCVTDTTTTINGNSTTTYSGNKLIIEFTVTPTADFLGGNQVPTNGEASAVYNNGEKIESFPLPKVDVDIPTLTIGVTTTDQNIYLTNNADVAALVTALDNRIDGTNNDFVNIKYEIKDGAKVIGTFEISAGVEGPVIPEGKTLAETIEWTASADGVMTPNLDTFDTKTYTIVATAEPNHEGTSEKSVNNATASVNVFKPVVYFQDSEINAGATPEYAKDNYVKVEWKNGNTLASNVTMRGTEPQLVYTYNPVAEPLNAESEVQITAVATTDQKTIALNNVTFIRNACNLANGCGHPGGTVDMTQDGYINFIVHMRTCDLVITKSVNKLENAADTFIFTVTGPNGFSKTVVINGAGSVTIADLPIGSYTVTEDTDWSWRYECSAPSITKTIAPNNNTFAFTNTFDPDSKWLTDTSYAKNLFGSTSADIK